MNRAGCNGEPVFFVCYIIIITPSSCLDSSSISHLTKNGVLFDIVNYYRKPMITIPVPSVDFQAPVVVLRIAEEELVSGIRERCETKFKLPYKM